MKFTIHTLESAPEGSNFVNHFAETPLDNFAKKFAWTPFSSCAVEKALCDCK